MAKVSEIQDQIRQAASALVEDFIAKAIEVENRPDAPISYSKSIVMIRVIGTDGKNPDGSNEYSDLGLSVRVPG